MKVHYDIFISYSQKDGEIAGSLASRLDDAGIKCFLADKSILASSEWDDVLREGLINADQILVLLTPRSKDSLWVAAEVGAAWVLRKTLIPALMFVEHKDLLEPVRKYQTRSVETPQQIEALVREIKTAVIGRFADQKTVAEVPKVFSTIHPSESFTSRDSWDRLLKVGVWQFDSVGKQFVGEGMYRYVLSHHPYGPSPFVIECQLTFLDLRPENGNREVNAGIVLGWSTPVVARQYFHLAFSGRSLFLERIGFRGHDEYLDYEHLTPETPFELKVNQPYDFSLKMTTNKLSLFCEGRQIFYADIPPGSIVGRVGLRPWRSTLSCQRFDVRAE